MMSMCKHFVWMAVMVLVIYGCGGGGSGKAEPNASLFPAGEISLAFSAFSTAKLPASVSGIDFSITLPEGMSVATATGSSGQIAANAVMPGGGLTGSSLAYGTYSASTRKVYLTMATADDTFRSGEFLELVCSVAPNRSITLDELRALNSPVAIKKAVGMAPDSTTTVVLTDSLKLQVDLAR